MKSYHLSRSVRITRFLADETFSRNSCVFWCVLKLQSLEVSIFELRGFEWFYGYMSQMQSAESQQLNLSGLFSFADLGEVIFKNCFSCLFIFWWQRILCVKTQLVAWGELEIIFWFQTFNYNTVYSYDGQSNSWRSNKIFI